VRTFGLSLVDSERATAQRIETRFAAIGHGARLPPSYADVRELRCPFVAHRDVSLRCGIWSLSGHIDQAAPLIWPTTASNVPKWSFDAGELDRETEVQTNFLHLFWGLFSVGHFAANDRKFGRHVKEIFSELYRQFESRSLRQQVIDIA
jgi:hypothetical protein